MQPTRRRDPPARWGRRGDLEEHPAGGAGERVPRQVGGADVVPCRPGVSFWLRRAGITLGDPRVPRDQPGFLRVLDKAAQCGDEAHLGDGSGSAVEQVLGAHEVGEAPSPAHGDAFDSAGSDAADASSWLLSSCPILGQRTPTPPGPLQRGHLSGPRTPSASEGTARACLSRPALTVDGWLDECSDSGTQPSALCAFGRWLQGRRPSGTTFARSRSARAAWSDDHGRPSGQAGQVVRPSLRGSAVASASNSSSEENVSATPYWADFVRPWLQSETGAAAG